MPVLDSTYATVALYEYESTTLKGFISIPNTAICCSKHVKAAEQDSSNDTDIFFLYLIIFMIFLQCRFVRKSPTFITKMEHKHKSDLGEGE